MRAGDYIKAYWKKEPNKIELVKVLKKRDERTHNCIIIHSDFGNRKGKLDYIFDIPYDKSIIYEYLTADEVMVECL